MPRTPKLTETQAEKVVQYYLNGNTVDSIAAEFNISPSTVRSTVKRSGYQLRPVGRPRVAGGGSPTDS